MISTAGPRFPWVTWGMLLIWLFFGSLSFAEKLSLLEETSSEDEEVLLWLASSLKTEVPALKGPLISPVLVPITSLPSHILPVSMSLPAWVSAHDLPALRPHQRVSVYRI